MYRAYFLDVQKQEVFASHQSHEVSEGLNLCYYKTH